MDKLSIVVPCYNEEESIPLFFPAVEEEVNKIKKLEVEYWFVMFHFHEILVKRRHFTLAYKPRGVTMSQ